MTTESITTIQQRYIETFERFDNVRKSLQDKIEAKSRQLKRLQDRLTKHSYTHPVWTEELLLPILKEIEKQLPGWTMENERLTPMGLGCKVSVFFHPQKEMKYQDVESKQEYIYIVFEPEDLRNAELSFETGEKRERYLPDSIGAINGFNRLTKRLESINEAVTFLQSQIKRLGYE